MNGTSMSSPNACGCITLLLSAARASNLPTTPVSVRRALENSAKFIPNVHVLGQGYGLVQVERAWEYLNATSDDTNKDISYKVSFNHPGFSNGIYLRQPNEANTANTYVATIDPEFPHNCSLDVKSNFEMRLELESTADWITIPKNVLLLQNGKQVSIFVDPRALPTGVHVEFVRVFDTSRQRSLGPILLIPVTVVRPIIVPSGAVSLDLGTLDLTPGERRRKYIVIPHGCTYIDCRVTDPREPTRSQGADADGDTDVDADPQSLSPDTVPTSVTSTATTATTTSLASAADDGARMIVLHALQLFKGTPYRDNEMHIYKNLTPGSEHVVSWAVHEEVTMELVVGRAWGCIGDTSCSVTLFFRGVLPSPSQLVLTAGQRVSSIVRIFAPLGTTEIAPEGKLTKWLSTIKSTSSKVSPLGERDVLPDGTSVYQLVIEYEIDLSEACDIIPRFPGLQGVLYESNFMSQFVMVYNSKKVLVGSGDAWPSSIKVTKGKYTVRLQVRHTSTTVLEGLSDLPLVLERSPKSSIPLSFYHTQTDAMAGSDGKFGSRVLHVGNSASFFVREPTADSLPKSVATGDVFVGSVTYVKKSASTIGSTDRPGGYPIRYTYVDTKSKAVSTTSTPSASASGESEKSLETLVKDVKIKYLKGLVGNETAFLAALDTVKAEFPDDLQVRLCAINHGDKLLVTEVTKAGKLRVENDSSINSKISQEIASLNKCIDLARISVNECTAIFPLINRDEIALELGKNLDKDNAAAVAARKEIDSKKSVLCEALHVRAKTYLHWINSVERLTVLAASPSDLPVESSAVPVTAATDSVTDGTVEALPTTTTAAPTASGTDTTVATLKEEFTAAYKELLVWDDGSAEKYATLQIARYLMQGHTGLALKKINDVLGTSEGKLTPVVRDSLMADREECWAQLGLGVVATASRNWKLLAARDGFEPF